MSITVRLTPALADELCARLIDEAPFDRIDGPGAFELDPGEAQSMLDDADLFVGTEGPGMALSFGMRQAYGRLAQQLREHGLRPTPVADLTTTSGRRVYGPPKPKALVALGDVEAGRWISHPVIGSCVVGLEDRVPGSRRHPELVPLHKQGPLGELGWCGVDELVELG